jgi:hypothetical protein
MRSYVTAFAACVVLLFAGCGKAPEGPKVTPPAAPPVAKAPSCKLTPLFAEAVEPSAQDRTVSYKGAVSVTVPGGLLKSREELRISSVEGAPAPRFRGLQHVALYDISMGRPRLLDKELVLEMAYDESRAKGHALWMEYWDEAQQAWVTLPGEVDRQKKVVRARTRHLCPTAVASAEQIADTEGRAVLPADRGKWYYANDYFMMTFYKSEVEASTCDKKNPKGFKEYQDASAPVVHDEMPRFVENVWHYVNQARGRYCPADGSGLRDLPKFDESAYVFKGGTNIFVGGGGSSSRNKFTGSVTITLDTLSAEVLKFLCAHELFHAIQARYFTCAGMTARKWWVEATADYAAEKIALGGTNQMGGDRINPRHFEKCLTASSSALYDAASTVEGGVRELVGMKPDKVLADDPHGNHEYTGAFFIHYLVDRRKVPFKELFETVSASYNCWTEGPLGDYLKTKGTSLPDCYRGYVAWWLFDPASPVYVRCGLKEPLKDLTTPGVSAEMGSEEGVMRQKFLIDTGHAARMWAFRVGTPEADALGVAVGDKVKVEVSSLDTTSAETNLVKSGEEEWAMDAYVFPKGVTAPAPAPAAVLRGGSGGTASAELRAAKGDWICLLLFNHGTGAREELQVTVTRPVLKMKSAYHVGAYVIGSDHAFAVKKEDSGIPGDAAYAWNFGDGTGGTGAELRHKYTAAGTFPVTVDASWKDQKLQAKSRIVIAPDQKGPAKEEVTFHVWRPFKNKMGKSKQSCNIISVSIYNKSNEMIGGGDAVATNGAYSIVLPVGSYTYKVGYKYTTPPDHGTTGGAFQVVSGGRNFVSVETPPYEAFDK